MRSKFEIAPSQFLTPPPFFKVAGGKFPAFVNEMLGATVDVR